MKEKITTKIKPTFIREYLVGFTIKQIVSYYKCSKNIVLKWINIYKTMKENEKYEKKK